MTLLSYLYKYIIIYEDKYHNKRNSKIDKIYKAINGIYES